MALPCGIRGTGRVMVVVVEGEAEADARVLPCVTRGTR
jgi:hypothetical protein